MKKESVDFYVLEVARLDGAKNENVRGMAETGNQYFGRKSKIFLNEIVTQVE